FTFVNERLATHYGLAGVTGAAFQKISLNGHAERGGLLTQGNIHVATSVGEETSPERRGLFVLRDLLCSDLPEPPANALEAQRALVDQLGPNATRRDVVEARDASPTCGACHQHFDPIGLSMENYDPTGAWRTEEHSKPLDVTVQLPNFGTVTG